MKQPKPENIEKYRKLCHSGASLKLLSVYCTLRHPHRRATSTPYPSKKLTKKSKASCTPKNNRSRENYPALPLCNMSSDIVTSPRPNVDPFEILSADASKAAVASVSFNYPPTKDLVNETSKIYNNQETEDRSQPQTPRSSKNEDAIRLFLERAPKASRRKVLVDDSDSDNDIDNELALKKMSNFHPTKSSIESLPGSQPKLPEISNSFNLATNDCDLSQELTPLQPKKFAVSLTSETLSNPQPLETETQNEAFKNQTGLFDTNKASPDTTPSLTQDSSPRVYTQTFSDSLPLPVLKPSTILSPAHSRVLENNYNLSSNSLGTPTRNPRLAATCVSFLNRSPYRGKTQPLANSPTVQLGNKVFHVPGSIFLGETASPQKVIKKVKPKRSRTTKKASKPIPEPVSDVSVSDTSDPYAFVPQKYKAKVPVNPVVTAETLESILLQTNNPESFSVLDNSDDEDGPDASPVKENTPPRQFSNLGFRFLDASPFRKFSNVLASPANHVNKGHPMSLEPITNTFGPDLNEDPENLGDLSIKMADLSFSILPDPKPTTNLFLSDDNLTSASEFKTTPITPITEYNFLDSETPRSCESNLLSHATDPVLKLPSVTNITSPWKIYPSKPSLFSDPSTNEPAFDVQAFLDQDLGMFAGTGRL